MTDDNGCATDPSIFGEWQYERNLGVLTASFNAFKFPASNNIRFQCNIRVCFGQCQPQNCAGSNAYGRRRRDTGVEGTVFTGQLREEIMVCDLIYLGASLSILSISGAVQCNLNN